MPHTLATLRGSAAPPPRLGTAIQGRREKVPNCSGWLVGGCLATNYRSSLAAWAENN